MIQFNVNLNINTLLVLTGVILLVINVGISAASFRQERKRTEVLSVVLALLACVLLVAGIMRASFSSNSPSYAAAITSGLPLVLIALVGATVVGASIYSYRLEAHRPNFNPGSSSSLLNIGAGAFALVAALVIPVIPLELSHAPASTRFAPASAALTSATSSFAPANAAFASTQPASATPTLTTASSSNLATGANELIDANTPILLPTLTPAPSETPIVLYTRIAYTSTYAVGITNACTITATTTLNLRGDPSVKQASIGRVFAGSLLNIIGRSADKKWWYAINTTGVNGWVSGDYVTTNSACGDVPVVDSSGHVISQTPTPDPVTPTDVPVANDVGTTGPCTLLTITSAYLRLDPSVRHVPLALIPDRTVLTATGQSVDKLWWQVAYGNAQGWVSANAVFASSSCAQVPALAPTANS